jgi:hypothetical protein
MKIFVITNEHGKVIGTARAHERGTEGPSGGRPISARGQRVHEITLPTELQAIRDVRELHNALEKHLPDVKVE